MPSACAVVFKLIARDTDSNGYFKLTDGIGLLLKLKTILVAIETVIGTSDKLYQARTVVFLTDSFLKLIEFTVNNFIKVPVECTLFVIKMCCFFISQVNICIKLRFLKI